MKEIVSVMLPSSGYQVIPYGYDIALSGLEKKLQEWGTDRSGDTILKIRASPDLLVYCPRKPVDDKFFELADLKLLEVKTRKTFGRTANFQLYDPKKIEKYKQHNYLFIKINKKMGILYPMVIIRYYYD